MTKRKVLFVSAVLLVMLAVFGCAFAAEDPIVATIAVDPEKLPAPGPVAVTVTVTNASDVDFESPITLYDPAANPVSDFGTNGSVTLAAGQTESWTGSYEVSQNAMDNGSIVYFLKYDLTDEDGNTKAVKQALRAPVSKQAAETDLTVKRVISPLAAREGQEVTVRYEIKNTGSVSLYDVTIQENKAIYKEKQTIAELRPGDSADLKYTVVMGTKDVTSGAKITYTSETKSKKQTYTVENQTIRYGTSKLTATLTSSAKGAVENGSVTLTLTLKNGGTLDYSDITVSDPILGDLFTDKLTGTSLAAGKSLKLEQEIPVITTSEYILTVLATDSTGSQEAVVTEPLTITAIKPEDALNLDVFVIADKTEVFEIPGNVRFTVTVSNTGNVDATDLTVMHGETKICTISKLPAGASRVIARDTQLSMAGKYRFTVTAKDPLEETCKFESNEIQVVFSMPTPAPATPTPVPDPPPEPTFVPATIPPKSDASIAPTAKLVNSILQPLMQVAGVLLIACLGLIIAALVRAGIRKNQAEKAVATFEGERTRNYESTETESAVEETQAEESAEMPISVPDEDGFISRGDEVDENQLYDLPVADYVSGEDVPADIDPARYDNADPMYDLNDDGTSYVDDRIYDYPIDQQPDGYADDTEPYPGAYDAPADAQTAWTYTDDVPEAPETEADDASDDEDRSGRRRRHRD